MVKNDKIRALSTEELLKKIDELKLELYQLRFRLSTGQLENTAKIKQVRKAIARMKTIITERERNIR